MMKSIVYIFSFFALMAASCQDVVQLNITSADSKLVVDGWLDSDSVPKVYLYKSLPYFETKEFPPVSGAVLYLNDGNQNYILSESKPGFYTTAQVKGVRGKTYTLTIQSEGKTYLAEGTMPQGLPRFDSVYFRPLPFGPPQVKGKIFTNFAYTEPSTPGDCYMARFSKNDTTDLKDLNFTNDQFINGIEVKDVIIGDSVRKGDHIRLEVYGIPKEYYAYLSQIIDNVYRQQGLFSPPLAPFKGNVNNGGLGFFRVSSLIVKDTIAP